MEHVKSTLLGGSLPVPSVQELAKERLTSVLARYDRDDQEPLFSNSTATLPEVPVIDMQKLLLPGELGSPELQKLDSACKDWGFFQVINHGVSSQLVEKVKAEIGKLFELLIEEKKKLRQRDGELDGFGQAFVVSDEQKLDWGDMFYMFTLPTHLRKPYIFSQLPQSFREAMEEYSEMVRNLAMEILLSMAKALKMDEEDMRELFEEGMQLIRINYYPPCPQPELVMGLTPPSDAWGLTILLQVNKMDGLQIKKDGMWIPIKPDAFTVNVGNTLEAGLMIRESMEHVESILLGGSLPVPSVQELAKEPLTSVPARYVRDDQEPPFSNGTAAGLPEIPVIDMQKLLLPGELGSPELRKLDSACKDWGFFQVINHGVSSQLVEKVKVEIGKLFELPIGEKKKLWQRDGDLDGFGQAFVVSEEQKLNWGDIFYMLTLPTHLRKPYIFPHLPQSFRETMEEYCEMVRNLAMEILLSMAKALKMDEEDMRELFEEGMQSIRINYYPPCPQPELVMGLSPHSDGGSLTILLHVNEMEGLQIKKDGMWIPIKPLLGAFTVNVGNTLEMVTNGIYRSIEHRAVVNSTKERLSMATFHGAKLDGDIGPAPSLVTPETPAMFRRTSVVDYFKGFYSMELEGKSYLDVFRMGNDLAASMS